MTEIKNRLSLQDHVAARVAGVHHRSDGGGESLLQPGTQSPHRNEPGHTGRLSTSSRFLPSVQLQGQCPTDRNNITMLHSPYSSTPGVFSSRTQKGARLWWRRTLSTRTSSSPSPTTPTYPASSARIFRRSKRIDILITKQRALPQ